MCTFTKNEVPEEMPQNAAFHQGLHCLLRLKTFSGYNTIKLQYCSKIITRHP